MALRHPPDVPTRVRKPPTCVPMMMGETLATSVAAMTDYVDHIAALCPRLPCTVPEAVDGDKTEAMVQ
ncbi:hypothetical protein C8J57DRAFT_1539034 [Mycena rebaudengoi]|nr:hypothetical protein C8J57DRAFT_1539034 [Mycena rebaudengoi]